MRRKPGTNVKGYKFALMNVFDRPVIMTPEQFRWFCNEVQDYYPIMDRLCTPVGVDQKDGAMLMEVWANTTEKNFMLLKIAVLKMGLKPLADVV